MKPFLIAFAASILAGTSPGVFADPTITVRAGDHDRAGCVVSFQAPITLRNRLVAIKGGKSFIQVDEKGVGTFMLNGLSKGEITSLAIEDVGAQWNAVEAKQEGDTLKLFADTPEAEPHRREIVTYQMQPGEVPEGVLPIFKHGAHLHPILSPSGKLVTGNHPPDHRWHRGVWFAWTDTEFEGRHPDFWNMGKGEGKDKSAQKLAAEIRFGELVKSWSGPVHGGFVSTHRWLDLSGDAEKEVLNETWEVTAYHTLGRKDELGNALKPMFLIDFSSTLRCAGSESLKLPKYYYGGLGVRGNGAWDPGDKVSMLTSNGDDRIKGDATKGKWVWLGGEVDGGSTGITVLIHPDNFRFPQPLRLNPKNPQLCIAPSQDGDWAIEPGKPFVSRYRLVIMDGKPDAGLLENLWADYAEPPQVEVHGL